MRCTMMEMAHFGAGINESRTHRQRIQQVSKMTKQEAKDIKRVEEKVDSIIDILPGAGYGALCNRLIKENNYGTLESKWWW